MARGTTMRRHFIVITTVALAFGLWPVAGVAANTPDPFPHLATGAEGPDVARLQEALAEAGFFNQDVDGVYDERTASAVVAFHKYLRVKRTDEFSAIDWHLLNNLPTAGLPARPGATEYVEVDLSRQLLFVVRDGEIAGILPVSTGGDHTYWSVRNGRSARASTPRGDFALRWRQTGWVCDRTTGWCVYKYWAFSDFYGLHGYRSVPAEPASHGCVRLTVWDADWIEGKLFIGMSVHIWDRLPAPEAPLVEPRVLIALGNMIG
ncbi:MAG TPA: L,D-transpeptidase family protein [Acidimicrobiia bacterium]|nr:L,D-transpeptidase family protein [Acidimicrobiia bacterium]